MVNGIKVIDAFLTSLKEKNPYDLICLDIMMPKIDGFKALKSIRDIEHQEGIVKGERVKIIMTTALNAKDIVMDAYDAGCEAFAAKPIDMKKFIAVMKNLKLID